LSRKLRWVNEKIDGYEPGGRRFESCWARFFSVIYRDYRCEQFAPVST